MVFNSVNSSRNIAVFCLFLRQICTELETTKKTGVIHSRSFLRCSCVSIGKMWSVVQCLVGLSLGCCNLVVLHHRFLMY